GHGRATRPAPSRGRGRDGSAPVFAVLRDVGLDPLLADLAGHRLLLGDLLGAEPHALHRRRLLLDHRALLMQRDLVLLLGDGRTAGRRVAVGLGDRLALDPDLLAADRHGDLLLLGHDVLAEPSPTGLAPLLPSPQLLLRTRHGVVRRRPGGVVADGAGWAGRLFVAGRAFLTV